MNSRSSTVTAPGVATSDCGMREADSTTGNSSKNDFSVTLWAGVGPAAASANRPQAPCQQRCLFSPAPGTRTPPATPSSDLSPDCSFLPNLPQPRAGQKRLSTSISIWLIISRRFPLPKGLSSAMKILIVDDHPLVREGVRHTLASLQRDVIVLEAGNANEALELSAQHPDLDLVMLDLALPGMPGLAVLEELRQRGCTAPVVVLSGSCERADVIAALNSGAMGFIPKLSSSELMLQALRLVFAGGVYIPPLALGMLDLPGVGGASDAAGPKSLQQLGLGERQRQVLALIAQGKPNKVIASDLAIAEPTVKAHITEILRALQVTNRSQAMIVARRFGIS